MGVSYEFNWYLVIAGRENIIQLNEGTYVTEKSDMRIYPVDGEIPLIIKNLGCIGIVKIKSLKIAKQSTIIEFEFIEEKDIKDSIAQHYYDSYLKMKSN